MVVVITMTEKYRYYSCLVPEALMPMERSNSEEEYPPSPPPRPPRSLTHGSFDTPARDYPQGQGQTQGYRGRDSSSSPSYRMMREGSPSFSQDGDRQFSYSDESPPPMPPRVPAWQYDADKISQGYNSDYKDYSNSSLSPNWINSPTGQGQFSPGAGSVKASSVYNFNQSTYSDPSSAVSQLSPGLPEVSPRRHTIDSNFPIPLVHNAPNSPALSHRSPPDRYSDSGSCENSPALPKRSPRKPNMDRPSYEYPQSTPRHHEYHQVKISHQLPTLFFDGRR